MMSSLWTLWTQYFPPAGPLTEANLPGQAGKVFIVTGGSSGVGYETSRILYGAGGRVWILTRSEENALAAIARIKAHYDEKDQQQQQQGPKGSHDTEIKTRGSLHFLHLDTADLATVRLAATSFVARESRLDVLFNNAGAAATAGAPRSRQGHEFHLATNALGAFLLTRLLGPLLAQTAVSSSGGTPDAVRVVWPASLLVDSGAPRGGIRAEVLLREDAAGAGPVELYAASKTGCWFLASEFTRRGLLAGGGAGAAGVLHLAANPGNLATNVWRAQPRWLVWLLGPTLRDAVHGAETYLFTAFSPEVTLEDAAVGRYVIPDGRWHPGPREDLLLALRGTEEGGTGQAVDFYEWCEESVKGFLE